MISIFYFTSHIWSTAANNKPISMSIDSFNSMENKAAKGISSYPNYMVAKFDFIYLCDSLRPRHTPPPSPPQRSSLLRCSLKKKKNPFFDPATHWITKGCLVALISCKNQLRICLDWIPEGFMQAMRFSWQRKTSQYPRETLGELIWSMDPPSGLNKSKRQLLPLPMSDALKMPISLVKYMKMCELNQNIVFDSNDLLYRMENGIWWLLLRHSGDAVYIKYFKGHCCNNNYTWYIFTFVRILQ